MALVLHFQIWVQNIFIPFLEFWRCFVVAVFLEQLKALIKTSNQLLFWPSILLLLDEYIEEIQSK